MRALIQRVTGASVTVARETVGTIEEGLLVFLGIAVGDGGDETEYICRKLLHLRIFEDQEGRMNRSVLDIGGSILLVSQFTLYGNLRKGRRPGFDRAAPPAIAEPLYQEVRTRLSREIPVATGRFGAKMRVQIENDGPATFWIDTAER